jgi:hypothetical protein
MKQHTHSIKCLHAQTDLTDHPIICQSLPPLPSALPLNVILFRLTKCYNKSRQLTTTFNTNWDLLRCQIDWLFDRLIGRQFVGLGTKWYFSFDSYILKQLLLACVDNLTSNVVNKIWQHSFSFKSFLSFFLSLANYTTTF